MSTLPISKRHASLVTSWLTQRSPYIITLYDPTTGHSYRLDPRYDSERIWQIIWDARNASLDAVGHNQWIDLGGSYEYVDTSKVSAVQFLKLVRCIMYNCMDHLDLRSMEGRFSAIAQLCEHMLHEGVSELPGYDDAAWVV